MQFKDDGIEDDATESVPSIPLQPATPTTKPITKSILLTIKKMLGVAEEYHAFDLDIIIDINSVFLTLNQLGVGPLLPYSIAGTEETWSDFLGDQEQFMAGVQTYVYLKTRLLFDPPTNSFLVDSMKKQCDEFEWRFTVQPKNQQEVSYVETFKPTISLGDDNQNGSDETEEPDEEEKVEEDSNVKRNVTKRNVSLYDIFS